MTEHELRQAIIDQCLGMNASGLNQGTSGNISARYKDRMLITPSGIPYDQLEPGAIASMALDGSGDWDGPQKPSSEWRFHHDILRARPEAAAVVHTHSTHATALSMTRRNIPPAHYMIALFGGSDVRCATYALFGTQALSDAILIALEGRAACLLANHGAVTVGRSLGHAMELATELETLAHQFILSLSAGGPVLLNDVEMAEAIEGFKGYGPKT